jgi:phenylalanyl-tRNA synthetase beta chain
MKISEKWLREWVNPPVDASTLAAKLNMAGLECEAEPLAAVQPEGVFVARIVSAVPHPQADRLRVCEVDAGNPAELLTIVCGAANARPGILVPAALPGAVPPSWVWRRNPKACWNSISTHQPASRSRLIWVLTISC